MPVLPRSTCGLPVGRWNWLRPTFIHMLSSITIRIRIAGQAEARAVEQRGDPLVGDRDVDVLEMDGIAEVLGGAVEGLAIVSIGAILQGVRRAL